ncbi:MAG: nicotinamide mononucleotide transporter [Proteobacteria bacterium]|nr:nicotinamide mononucleotide transporter [Pseudomonadota bacterium]
MITPLEIAANGITTVSILLAGRNSVHTWWTGIIGSLLFAALFYSTQLYADVVLQFFFLVTSALGWWQWRHGNRGGELPVRHAGWPLLALAIPIGVVATLGYGALLFHYTNAYAPFVDSAVLVFSIIAQIFLMQRRIENWLFWLLVNSIAVPLYASRGLHLTPVLYAAYWVNAIVSWFWWRRLAASQVTAPAAA